MKTFKLLPFLVLLVLMGAGCNSGGNVPVTPAGEVENRPGRIISDTVMVYDNWDDSAELVGTLHKGDVLTVTFIARNSTRLQAGSPQFSTPFWVERSALKLDFCIPLTEGFIVYVVQPGDNLYGISKRYGIGVSELKRINCKTSNFLFVGEDYIVPEPIKRKRLGKE